MLSRKGTLLAGAAFAALAAATLAAGCEAIVPSSVATPSCTMTPYVDPGNGTCPSGMYCAVAGCKACQSKDICDGLDNDCDGIIDDGPYSDHDGDGFTYCGKQDATGEPVPHTIDCDDTNPKVSPNGDEICNGKDDNCDGIIDNPNLVCPPSETCVPKTGQCISAAAVCVPCSTSNTPGCCGGTNVCDPGTQQCVPPGTTDAGSSCSGDLACSTGICSDPAELGPTPGITTCTSPCCTSGDCPADAICWGAGTGGNYCIPGSAVGRTSIGTNAPGASCSRASDCRSGVCGSSGKCEDTCCGDSTSGSTEACTNGTTCTVTSFANNTTFACVTTTGTTPPNSHCSSNADCASGYCANYCGNTSCTDVVSLCAQPCCSSKQCGQYQGNQFVCNDDYYPPLTATSSTPPPGSPVVGVCDAVQQTASLTSPPPTGQVGDTCQSSTDCYSNLCTITSGTTGYCSDVCCVDSDCAKTGYVCRPTQQGSGTYLRCIPDPKSE
jgi:hypothetical protein